MLVSVYFHTHAHPHPLSTANIEISIVFHNLLRIKTHISATIGLGIVPIEIIQFFLLTTGRKKLSNWNAIFGNTPVKIVAG